MLYIYIHTHTLLLFSCSVMSDSLQPQGLQHTRLPCPSPSPRACPNSCPLSQWCRPTISSSVPFSSCLQIFPRIRAFSNESALHIMWPKYWSFIFSVGPSNEYSGLTGLISMYTDTHTQTHTHTHTHKTIYFRKRGGIMPFDRTENKKIHEYEKTKFFNLAFRGLHHLIPFLLFQFYLLFLPWQIHWCLPFIWYLLRAKCFI